MWFETYLDRGGQIRFRMIGNGIEPIREFFDGFIKGTLPSFFQILKGMKNESHKQSNLIAMKQFATELQTKISELEKEL